MNIKSPKYQKGDVLFCIMISVNRLVKFMLMKKIKKLLKQKRRKKMDVQAETLTINGITYVKADSKQVTNTEGKKFVIVRTYSAGVFAGFLDSRNGQEVILLGARRLWYWKGAASLSQLAIDGVKNPDECKFPAPVPRVELLQAIEILEVSEKAKKSIDGVKIWQM